MATVDIPALQNLVEEGYLTCRPHPIEDLVIWNYTPKTMYEGLWMPATRMCRGLITTSSGTVVSRCLPKFWNVEEYEEPIPLEPFVVTEKIDGSMGVSYFIGDEMFLATRGSFTSWQAAHANKLLERYRDYPFQLFHKEYTYIFEIVLPENRIVVDYGDTEDLILLAVLHTETGKEVDIHSLDWFRSLSVVKRYAGIKDIAELKEMEEENKEGFVIRFESGLRLKAKNLEYVRLHRIITQTTARTIWEYLKENRSLSELYERVPEEFSQWLKATTRDLMGKYDDIYRRTKETYKDITSHASIPLMIALGASLSVRDVETISRAMKKHIQQEFHRYPDIEPFLLMLYDGGYDKKERVRMAIWETLRPEATRPFRNEEGEEAA